MHIVKSRAAQCCHLVDNFLVLFLANCRSFVVIAGIDFSNDTSNDMYILLRVLIGVTEKSTPAEVGSLLNSSGVDLLLSGVLRANSKTGTQVASAVQQLYDTQNQTKLAWNVGDREQGHLASLVGSSLVKFNQMLLLTLPGTPVFNYGDEIGLEDTVRVYGPRHDLLS